MGKPEEEKAYLGTESKRREIFRRKLQRFCMWYVKQLLTLRFVWFLMQSLVWEESAVSQLVLS